jgi:hypothetical protein
MSTYTTVLFRDSNVTMAQSLSLLSVLSLSLSLTHTFSLLVYSQHKFFPTHSREILHSLSFKLSSFLEV